METSIFGFCVDKIRQKLQKSKKYFGREPFVTIECDVWTAQSNLAVLGVGCTFYDVDSKKAITIVLGVVPLLKGKTAVELKTHLLKILSMFGIEKEWLCHLVGDGENSVQKALAYVGGDMFYVDRCFAHEIQTWTRHATACGKKLYKRDPYVPGNNFFNKIRAIVNMFTKSPLKERRLKRIQLKTTQGRNDVTEYSDTTSGTLLSLCKFSDTRWSRAYNALARIYRLEASLKLYFTDFSLDEKLK